MSNDCSLHRLPRAGIDPISAHADALFLVTLVAHQPLRHETIVLLLDHERRGISILVVSGTVPFDALFDVLDVIVGLELDELGAIVVGTVRPPAPDPDDDERCDLDEHDVDRWLEATAMLDDRGLDLLEWFVIGESVTCPRDVFGEPPRW